MPVFFIEALPGIRTDAKKRMVDKITAGLDEAYHVPDVRIFLREYTLENAGQDGVSRRNP